MPTYIIDLRDKVAQRVTPNAPVPMGGERGRFWKITAEDLFTAYGIAATRAREAGFYVGHVGQEYKGFRNRHG